MCFFYCPQIKSAPVREALPDLPTPPKLRSPIGPFHLSTVISHAYELIGHRAWRFPESHHKIYGRAETINISGRAETDPGKMISLTRPPVKTGESCHPLKRIKDFDAFSLFLAT